MIDSGAGCTVTTVLPETDPSVADTVAVPAETPVPNPAAFTETEPLLDAQDTCVVRFCVDPSEYVPVAVNCCVPPAGKVGFDGVTADARRTAERYSMKRQGTTVVQAWETILRLRQARL